MPKGKGLAGRQGCIISVQKQAPIRFSGSPDRQPQKKNLSAGQEGRQPAFAIQRHQVVATTDVGLPNKNLGHGAAAGDGHHGLPFGGQQVHADFIELSDAARPQKLFGMVAIGAAAGGVDLDGLHGVFRERDRAINRAVVRLFQAAGWHLSRL